MIRKGMITLLLLLASGCAQEPTDYSELDLSVGHGSVAGANIAISGGLGAILEMRSGYIELWLQSPAVTVTLDLAGSAVEDWRIVLRNAVTGMTHLNPVAVNSSTATQAGTTYTVDINAAAGGSYALDFSTVDVTATDAFSFAVLSDIQDAIGDVGDIYSIINGDASLRFVVSAGDLAHDGTTSQMRRFRDVLFQLNIPFYGTPGNHDTYDGQYAYWRTIFGRASFTFRYKGATFIFADSSGATIEERVYGWLKSWVPASGSDVQFFISHYPAIDPCGARNGGFSSRNEAYKLIAILGGGDVEAIFNGHIHSYYHFDTAGIDTYISGGGGGHPELYDGVGRHYLKVTVNAGSGSYSVSRVDVD